MLFFISFSFYALSENRANNSKKNELHSNRRITKIDKGANDTYKSRDKTNRGSANRADDKLRKGRASTMSGAGNGNGIAKTETTKTVKNAGDTKIDAISELIDYFEENINLRQKEAPGYYSDKSITETYAGMVGDKRIGDMRSLDIVLERSGNNGLLLVVGGERIGDEKIINTHMEENPTRYVIDVDTRGVKDRTMNFTYQMPKSVRLRYKQKLDGYTITIDLPIGTRVINFVRNKNEVSVRFAVPRYIDTDYSDSSDAGRVKSDSNKSSMTKDLSRSDKSISSDEKVQTGKISNKTTSDSDSIGSLPVVDSLRKVDEKTNFGRIHVKHSKPFVIAIDAGHGGIDPGAIGTRGVYEKTITLMYARRLAVVLQKKGFKVIMTRKDDRTIPLSQRVKIAQSGKADLFISLHTDAHRNCNVSGTTVYRLSNIREDHPDWNRFYNRNYLPSRYERYVDDRNILDILIGLSRQSLSEKTSIIADNILLSFKKNNICKICRHGQRSLAVLRGLDVASILIEIGYITNSREERKMLMTSNIELFIRQLANTIERTFVN